VTDWYETTTLPLFERPPVTEVAMAIEFAPIAAMDFFKLSRLQAEWEDDYPTIAEMPGAPPTQLMQDAPTVTFALGGNLRRIWATSIDGTQLLQSQNDRLILNWRKVDENTEYPGFFDSLRDEFTLRWGALNRYLAKAGLPAPIPVLAEYNYVNAVALNAEDTLEDVVTVVRTPRDELPGQDRFTQFAIVREVTESETDPYTTQISISGQPQMTASGERQLFFTVVAKALVGTKTEDPLKALDAAHALASHSFARIVTEKKQAEWGRVQ
jgi:uncharacterized protein (TIGR04255 family)